MEQKESSFGAAFAELVYLCPTHGHPSTHKWFPLPKAPSEEGVEAATPDPQIDLHLRAPQSLGHKLLTVAN